MLAIQACTIIAGSGENLREIAMEIGCTLHSREIAVEIGCALHSREIAMEIGSALHSSAIRKSPMLDAFLCNTLVNMYGRCGSSVSRAEHAFDVLRHRRDLAAWNAMLLAYAEQGDGQKALQLYVHMQQAAGMNPDRLTTIFALRACCVLMTTGDEEAERELFAAREIGKSLHIDACKKGFDDADEFVGCSLMKMYGRTDAIAEVESVFGGLSGPDVASWNAMLSAYVELMHKSDLRSALLFGQRALCVYRQMEEEHVSDPLSCVLALQACTNLVCEDGFVEGQSFKALALEVGRALHADARKKGFASNLQVGRALHADAHCNGFASNLEVGRALHADAHCDGFASDLEVGTALHADAHCNGFASNLEVGRALHANAHKKEFASNLEVGRALHANAHCNGFASDLDVGRTSHANARKKEFASDLEVGRGLHADARNNAFASDLEVGRALHADAHCDGFASDLEFGRALHADARKKEFASDLEVGRALHADARCNGFASDLQVGRALHADARTKGFASDLDVGRKSHANARCNGFASDLEFGRASLHADARCDGFASDLVLGRASVHADARKKGFASNVFVGNAVISLYGRCGAIMEAEHVFSSLLRRDCTSWTSMLSTYVEQGLPERCLQLYTQMIEDGVRPDAWTYVVLLQACSAISGDRIEPSVSSTDSYRLDIGSSLHASIAARGFASDIYVSSTLVSMYGKCRGASIEEAENVFGSLLGPKLVSWTAMLSAYLERGHASKALDVYKEMAKRGICSNDVALNCALQACSATGSLEMCREIHFGLVSSGCDRVPWVAATLIHAYGSCTSMRDGQAFFGTLLRPGIVAWNACISGHAAKGGFLRSLDAFKELKAEGVLPDEVTYTAILSACGHIGAVDRGLECFESMSNEHGLVPGVKHYCSMVDLLGRVGDLQGLCCFLERIPVETDLRFWVCILGSCCTHGSSELARYAFHNATQQAVPRT
jgi:pentatricopeptide repeat protein